MKKVLTGFLAVTIIFFTLTGCSSKKETTGAYSEQRAITANDTEIFKTALGDKASNYELLKVATQVVAGTNYKFYAKDNTVQDNTFVYIVVFVSLDTNTVPVLVDITPAKGNSQ